MERKAADGTLYMQPLSLALSSAANAAHTSLHAARLSRAESTEVTLTTHPREQSFMSQMLRTKHRHRLQQKMNNHQHHQPGQQQQAAAKVANGSADNRPLHLQCVDKVHEFPVLEAAFGSFSSLYGRVKVRDQRFTSLQIYFSLFHFLDVILFIEDASVIFCLFPEKIAYAL
jgi:hypothetical protein